MKPDLFSFHMGGREAILHTYGVAIAVGFAVGIWLAVRQARRAGLDTARIMDLSFWLLVSGLVGARLFFVAINWGDYARMWAGGDYTAALRVWQGGMVFYGGALAAAAVALFFSRWHGWHFGQVADVFAPGLAIGHAIGRLGCFAAGCCFGKTCGPAGCLLGVAFPPGSVAFDDLVRHGLLNAGLAATPILHPAQLYEAAAGVFIFLILIATRARWRFRGASALLYTAIYAALRFAVEIYRGDGGRRFLLELSTPRLAGALGLPAGEPLLLSTSQALGIVLGVAAQGARVILKARHDRSRDPPGGVAIPKIRQAGDLSS